MIRLPIRGGALRIPPPRARATIRLQGQQPAGGAVLRGWGGPANPGHFAIPPLAEAVPSTHEVTAGLSRSTAEYRQSSVRTPSAT
jgi:hypothetical protein